MPDSFHERTYGTPAMLGVEPGVGQGTRFPKDFYYIDGDVLREVEKLCNQLQAFGGVYVAMGYEMSVNLKAFPYEE